MCDHVTFSVLRSRDLTILELKVLFMFFMYTEGKLSLEIEVYYFLFLKNRSDFYLFFFLLLKGGGVS